MQNRTFIAECMPENGTGQTVALAVKKKLEDKGIVIRKVCFICGDSTNANTGYKDGSFAWFEEIAGRPFHWIVCVSHLIELPLRKVTQLLIGDTSGPGSFKR